MQSAEHDQPAPKDTPDAPDDDDTRIQRPTNDDDDTRIVQRPTNDNDDDDNDDGDDDTRIVQRPRDEHTRIVARTPRGSPPRAAAASEAPYDGADPSGEATVRSSRDSTANDTLLSRRRASALTHAPVLDPLQRRYEPPPVQSGASVRYAARPTSVIVEPTARATVADVQPDPSRLRLADAAAEIRQRAAAASRRRRRFTLIAITSSTTLVVLAAAFTAFILLTR
jgi:hypothetical protein